LVSGLEVSYLELGGQSLERQSVSWLDILSLVPDGQCLKLDSNKFAVIGLGLFIPETNYLAPKTDYFAPEIDSLAKRPTIQLERPKCLATRPTLCPKDRHISITVQDRRMVTMDHPGVEWSRDR